MLYGSTSSQPVSRMPNACLRRQVSEPGTEEAFQGESLTSVQRSCDISRSLGWSIRLELTSLALQRLSQNGAAEAMQHGKCLNYQAIHSPFFRFLCLSRQPLIAGVTSLMLLVLQTAANAA